MSRYHNLQRLKQLKGTGNKAFGTPRDLLEPQQSMCFQVFAIVVQSNNAEERFEKLSREHQVELDKDNYVRYVQAPKIGEVDFRPSLLLLRRDGTKAVQEVSVQTLYTSTDKNLVRQVQDEYKSVNYVCTSNEVLNEIMGRYIPVLEEKVPNLSFGGKRYCDIDGLSVEFMFGVQPYRSDFCNPMEIGVLKPITAIDGYVIEPKGNVAISSFCKKPHIV